MTSPYGYTKPTFMITDHTQDPYHLQPGDEDDDQDEDEERHSKLQEIISWLHLNAKHRSKW